MIPLDRLRAAAAAFRSTAAGTRAESRAAGELYEATIAVLADAEDQEAS